MRLRPRLVPGNDVRGRQAHSVSERWRPRRPGTRTRTGAGRLRSYGPFYRHCGYQNARLAHSSSAVPPHIQSCSRCDARTGNWRGGFRNSVDIELIRRPRSENESALRDLEHGRVCKWKRVATKKGKRLTTIDGGRCPSSPNPVHRSAGETGASRSKSRGAGGRVSNVGYHVSALSKPA